MSKPAAAIFCALYTVRGYPGRFLWADGAVRGVSYLTELQEYCERGDAAPESRRHGKGLGEMQLLSGPIVV